MTEDNGIETEETEAGKKASNDYDSPWKEALERYFPQFMQLLFPVAHAEIDWSCGHEFLDTELQKLLPDSDTGRKHADKLVKVYTLAGVETWVLIHVEIQARAGNDFNERMYRYNYHLADRYPGRDITSFAVMTNQRDCEHLGDYQKKRWGTTLTFSFPVINLQSWRDDFTQLENSDNPFSLVILAQLVAHNVKDDRRKFNAKFHLIRLLYRRGYDKTDIYYLLKFIDWMLLLPDDLALQLVDEVNKIEESEKMPYVTTFERFAMERGEARGIVLGEAQTLLKQLKLKFGSVTDWAEEKINSADKAQLDIWVERILTAETIEALFEEE